MKIKPNDFNLLTRLGDANLALHKYDEAAKWYEQALKSKPRNEATLQNLAQALVKKGDKVAANNALKQLGQVNPRNPEIAQLRSRLQ